VSTQVPINQKLKVTKGNKRRRRKGRERERERETETERQRERVNVMNLYDIVIDLFVLFYDNI